MARFNAILTDAGSVALTQALYRNERIFPDYARMGSGIYGGENHNTLTDLVNFVDVGVKVIDREFVEGTEEHPPLLKVSLQTQNTNLTAPTPIREIMLYANSAAGTDMANAIPFAYAWIDGDDTDNIIPPPLVLGKPDALHLHEMAIFVTNQEKSLIEVRFTYSGFVTHRYLEELLENAALMNGVELSSMDIPAVGTRTHYRIVETISG